MFQADGRKTIKPCYDAAPVVTQMVTVKRNVPKLLNVAASYFKL